MDTKATGVSEELAERARGLGIVKEGPDWNYPAWAVPRHMSSPLAVWPNGRSGWWWSPASDISGVIGDSESAALTAACEWLEARGKAQPEQVAPSPLASLQSRLDATEEALAAERYERACEARSAAAKSAADDVLIADQRRALDTMTARLAEADAEIERLALHDRPRWVRQITDDGPLELLIVGDEVVAEVGDLGMGTCEGGQWWRLLDGPGVKAIGVERAKRTAEGIVRVGK